MLATDADAIASARPHRCIGTMDRQQRNRRSDFRLLPEPRLLVGETNLRKMRGRKMDTQTTNLPVARRGTALGKSLDRISVH